MFWTANHEFELPSASLPASLPVGKRARFVVAAGLSAVLMMPLTSTLFCIALTSPATAQSEENFGASYLPSFPEGDSYRMQIIGDAMAEGMLSGIVEAFGTDTRVQLNKKHRALAGLSRQDADDEIKQLEDLAAKDSHHINVIMLGVYDRQPIKIGNGKPLAFGSEGWRTEYGRRVDRLIKAMKRRSGAVYWVGLPVVGKSDWNDDIQVINDIVRDRAYINSVKYIDAFAGFADESGAFNRYGPDLAGKFQLLRATDGIQFTAVGNRKLAHFPEREIKRDITQARAERSVPLAGAEPEQRKVAPNKSAEAAPGAAVASTAKTASDARASWSTQSNLSTTAPAPLPTSGQAEQRADNSRLALKVVGANGREETVQIELLRPAIPASVIQLMARNGSPEKATQVGDTVQETMTGGLVVLSSITPANDSSGSGGRAKLAPTQTPYFKVMVKGERMPSRPGRADDFRWPRQDIAPEQMVQLPTPVAPTVLPVSAPTSPPAKKTSEPKRTPR